MSFLSRFFIGGTVGTDQQQRVDAIKEELRESGLVKHDLSATKTWRSTVWDSLDKAPLERRFIFKLDVILLTLASLGYFIKQLDEQNINNAFVSGMKEDLGLYGDELSNAKALYTAGYVIGQIPSNLLLTRISPARWIPFAELSWTLLTLGMYGVNNKESIYAIRFLIGLFESTFYPGMQFMVGSFYRSDELAKRAIIFHTSGGIGRLFSGILQAAVYTNLDGKGGLAGWRWLFISNFIISLPIALAGFVFLPNLPHNMVKNWMWSERDIAICQLRMEAQGRKASEPWSKAKARRIFGGWKIWVLPPLYMFWNNAVSGIIDIFPFWLKARTTETGGKYYTIPQINHYPLPTTGITVVTALLMAWISDGALKGSRWPMQLVSSGWALTSAIILLAIPLWNSPKLHFYLYYSFGCLGGQSGMILTWINELCSADQEERALTVGAANDFAYLMQIWENLAIWRTSLMPRAIPGTIFTICFLVCQMLWIGLILLYIRRERRKTRFAVESEVASDVNLPTGEEKPEVEAPIDEAPRLRKN